MRAVSACELTLIPVHLLRGDTSESDVRSILWSYVFRCKVALGTKAMSVKVKILCDSGAHSKSGKYN